MFGGADRIRHGLRRENGEHAVGVRVLGGEFDRFGVTLGPASPRMSMGLLWLQCGGSSLSSAARVLSESSASWPPELTSMSVASAPGPPALVTMARRGPRGRGCFAKHFGHVEQFLDGVHPQHTDPAKGGIEHFIAAGERTGVRSGGLRGGFRATDLDDDDRFRERDFARGGKKARASPTDSM